MSRPTKCIVDLKKLKNNFHKIKDHVNTKVLALVKADAYGHGLIECSKALCEEGIDYLGTASLEEAKIIREAGINCPILCVGVLPQESENICVDYSVDQAVSTLEEIERIETYAKKVNKQANVHIKIETGMHRTGIRAGDELNELLKKIHSFDHLCIKGVFTHFALSDSIDKEKTLKQAECFKKAVDQIKNFGFCDVLVHCANSGAILQYPSLTFDMVRAGIILYGYYPSDETLKTIQIEPVLDFTTNVVAINKVYKGETIGYGCTFEATRDMTVAVLPVGYGDGYKRLISNRGYVLINGKKAPVTGRICMDMTMVDITDIPEVKIGDEAVLIGEQKGEKITADDLAEWSDTISYEIILSITGRVPKIYV